MEGLLRHLQAKWARVADQLGPSLQLHLTGSPKQQPDRRLSWTAHSVSTSVTVSSVV